MPEPSVLAILVAHASGSWLGETLAAVGALDHPGLRLVVVTVGDVRIDTDAVPADRLLGVVPVEAGTGYGGAVAAGLRAHGEDPHPYVLLLHDDVAPEPDALATVIERAEAEADVAAVGAKLVEWSDPAVLQEVGAVVDRFGTRRTGLDADEVDHGQHDDASEVLFCSSAFLLVRRSALEDVGGIDAGAWPLYEDVDLCWRLRARGHRVIVEPRARARHAAGLSRGLRRAGGRGFGAMAVRTAAERGRLRFMVKNYAPVSLFLILPQWFLFTALSVLGGILRREFWRLRAEVSGVGRVVRELPHILDLRRRAPSAEVDDQDLLRLSARRAATARRSERLAFLDRSFDAMRRSEERAASLLRDPITWAAVGALLVLVLALRDVLFGASFTLGELRRIPTLGDAFVAYVERPHPSGLDPYGPGTPGLVILGALRWLAFGSAAAAQKLALLLPLLLAAGGASRLGRVLAIGGRNRAWFAILAAVNPVTLYLASHGLIGPLVTWAASMWVTSVSLAPRAEGEDRRERIRRRSRWALGWILVVSLHPPAFVWLTALSVALAAARHGDGLGGRRRWLLATGMVGAFVGGLPWSLQWFTPRTPLVGRMGGFLAGETDLLGTFTLDVGWTLLALVAVALVATYVAGVTRTSLALAVLMVVVWIAGLLGVFPAVTAAAVVGWSALALLAFVARRVSDELSRYELGWRHAVVVGVAVLVAVAWLGGAVGGVVAPADPHTLPIVPTTADEEVGRVLWLDRTGSGTLGWVTPGFTRTLGAFPIASGPELRTMLGGVDAARDDRIHRLGAVLALGDISHIVALDGGSARGLGEQADLSPSAEQGGAVIFRNDAWMGPAMLLAAPPRDVLTPEGLAELVLRPATVEGGRRAGGGVALALPEDAEGTLYVAVGARGGWSIGGVAAQASAAGVHVDAAAVSGVAVEAEPPPAWAAWLYLLQALVLLALMGMWLASVYLTGPDAEPHPFGGGMELRMPTMPPPVAVLPIVLVAAALWMAWSQPLAADERFLSTAWYCPPAGEGFEQRLAVANPTESPVEYVVRDDLAAPPQEEREVAALGRDTIELDPTAGGVVESYGSRVLVATTVSRERTDAAVCARRPSDRYHFPEGGRAALRAIPRLFERYVLYNPFPEDARASVRFFGPDEAVSPPAFQDIHVPPGETVEVDPENQFFFPLELSTRITVWQGRAVVARRLRTQEDLSFEMGTEPARSGVLPRAGTDGGVTEIIAMNPTDRSVRIQLNVSGERGSIEPVDFEIDPQSRTEFDLSGPAPDEPTLLVRLEASQPIPIESLVVPGHRQGISILPPLEPARRWALPLAEGRTLHVVNPGTAAVRLSFQTLGDGPRIEDATVGPSRTLRIPLEDDGDGFGVIVTTRGGSVVAAAAGLGGSLPGIPL